jgi:hypothetical protein
MAAVELLIGGVITLFSFVPAFEMAIFVMDIWEDDGEY